MEKLLVTQALDERDLLAKKIVDKISAANFIDVIKNNEDKVIGARVDKAEFDQAATSALQQINDLIDRYNKIDAALVASNAKTMIETSYGTFTIAGAISMRTRLRNEQGRSRCFETMLRRTMEDQYSDAVNATDIRNRQLAQTAEGMRLSILGKDTKSKDDRPLDVVDTYVRENTTVLADPIGIKDKIAAMREKQDTLLRELDTQVKVSNATTYIEI